MRFKAVVFCAAAALAVTAMLLLPAQAGAWASSNIPLESRVYGDLEYLEVRGLIKSGMLSTRPFTWMEGARLFYEAEGRWNALGGREKARDERAGALIRRLSRRFGREAAAFGGPGGRGAALSLRPGRAYAEYVYGGGPPFFADRDNSGDEFRKGSNLRAGLDAELRLSGAASFYINPEYRSGDGLSEVEIKRGYLTAGLGNIEVEAGRDSMWWGPGRNGGLLLTNNADPLEMVKLTSGAPFVLPWVFKKLGLIKPTVFLARLEKDRDFPRARLLGMRIDMKPAPAFQLGLNRVFIFGGQGRRGLTAGEWVEVFFASDGAEHADSPINGNQLASIDASLVLSFDNRYAPFSGMKLYTEWGAEDSSGQTKTPTGRANIYGLFLTGPFWVSNADLRVEWANTARSARYGPLWYEHGVYSTGYRHRGRVIGHHIGGDARDLFVRLQYHTLFGATIGAEHERLETGVHSASPALKRWYELDIHYPVTEQLSAKAFWGLEENDGSDGVHSAGLSLSWVW